MLHQSQVKAVCSEGGCECQAKERPLFSSLSAAFTGHYTAFRAFSAGVGFHAGTGADQIAVAEHVVYAAHGGPELVVVQPVGRA